MPSLFEVKENLREQVKKYQGMEGFKGELPEPIISSLANYVVNGVEPGSALKAVLVNDLHAMAQKLSNEVCIRTLVGTVRWGIPHTCWGSKEIVHKWIKKGGLSEEGE